MGLSPGVPSGEISLLIPTFLSFWDYLQEFSQGKFLLRIPPGVPSGDISRGFIWGLLQKFPLGVPPGVPSGYTAHISLWGFLHDPLGIPPRIPSRDSSRSSLWRNLYCFPLKSSSKGTLSRFLQQFPQGIPLGDTSEESFSSPTLEIPP